MCSTSPNIFFSFGYKHADSKNWNENIIEKGNQTRKFCNKNKTKLKKQ